MNHPYIPIQPSSIIAQACIDLSSASDIIIT